MTLLMSVKFRLLNTLKKSALASIRAFSPSTFIEGSPNDFWNDMSRPKNPGPRKLLRPTPGGGGIVLSEAKVGTVKY